MNYEESIKAIENSEDIGLNDKLTWLASALGNLMSGMRADTKSKSVRLEVNGKKGLVTVVFRPRKEI